ncbi:hypothetical protein R1flu_003799 [Riccia fluitans]|uniref:Uncharacterized protein n=1 Tax=Riccia fluitans TaxID=41844 RepID=A0ABD1YA02_9MARC
MVTGFGGILLQLQLSPYWPGGRASIHWIHLFTTLLTDIFFTPAVFLLHNCLVSMVPGLKTFLCSKSEARDELQVQRRRDDNVRSLGKHIHKFSVDTEVDLKLF